MSRNVGLFISYAIGWMFKHRAIFIMHISNLQDSAFQTPNSESNPKYGFNDPTPTNMR